MKIQIIKKFAAVCARCQDVGPETYSHETAARAARDAGWTDQCADCRKIQIPAKNAVPIRGLVA